MPDHGVNVVEEGTSIVDTVLTPRLAARFERAIAADEEGRAREVPTETRRLRIDGGLFEIAMVATAPRAPRLATVREHGVSDPATLRALARAAQARGREILAAGAHAGGAAAREDVASVLDDPKLVGATAPAMLEVAIEACTRNAATAGTRATLRRFAEDVRAPASPIASQLARVALGVVAMTPDVDGSVTRAGFSLGERLARARRAIALRATRAAEIEQAAAAARAETRAEIERERAARKDAADRARWRAVDELERWEPEERRAVEERARSAHAEAVERTTASLAGAEERAQHRRLAEHAALGDHAMRVRDALAAAYELATADRYDAAEAAHARWEHTVAALQAIEDDEIRQRLLQDGYALHTRAIEAARGAASAIEQAARAEREGLVALAAAREEAEAHEIEMRYEATCDRARRAHQRALELARDTLHATLAAFERELAERRARIETEVAIAYAAADEEAARRIADEVSARGEAAARARAAVFDALVDELTGGGAS